MLITRGRDGGTTPMVPDLVCGNDGIDGWQRAGCARWEHGTALLRRAIARSAEKVLFDLHS